MQRLLHPTVSHVFVALTDRVQRRDRQADEAAQCMQVAPDPRRRFVKVILVIENQVLLFELNDEYASNGLCWSLPCSVAPAGFDIVPAAEALCADTGIDLPVACFQLVHVARRTESGPAFICYYRVSQIPRDGKWPDIPLPSGAKSLRWFQEGEIAALPLYSESDAAAIRLALRGHA